MRREDSLMWVPAITVEKVVDAKTILDLPDACSKKEIRSAYLRLAKKWHPDVSRKNASESNKLILTKEAIRRDQEDSLEWHRRQFGNEPLWSGGIYDNPFHANIRNSSKKARKDGKFGGIC